MKKIIVTILIIIVFIGIAIDITRNVDRGIEQPNYSTETTIDYSTTNIIKNNTFACENVETCIGINIEESNEKSMDYINE